jgi:hypothetical protein
MSNCILKTSPFLFQHSLSRYPAALLLSPYALESLNISSATVRALHCQLSPSQNPAGAISVATVMTDIFQIN